jgi:regulatory protein
MELLYKRARERALYILDSSYKTESQMRQKLKQGFYPDTIVDKVVEYLLEYRLLDDFRYASMYIEYKSESKSKKQLIQDLYAKGISKEIIEEVFLQSDYSDEQSLHRIVEKKLPRYNMEDPKEVQKLYRYLVGKGYRYNDVKNALSKYTTLE